MRVDIDLGDIDLKMVGVTPFFDYLIKDNSVKLKNLVEVNLTQHKFHPLFLGENPTVLTIQIWSCPHVPRVMPPFGSEFESHHYNDSCMC